MSNKAKIREEAKKLNPIDDLMFRKLAEDKEFCQEILRVILNDNKLIVLESTPQWVGANLQGRSVILDAKCIKGDGSYVDIEVQKADRDDHQRRVHYNGAILTTNTSNPDINFEDIPDVTVVFISKFDIFKGNLPLYHVDRIVRETGEVVDNGFYEVYVNTKVKDGSEVSDLMDVFINDESYNYKFPKTSDAKHRYKETEEGLTIMCEIMEKLTTEAKTEGKIETLIDLVKDNVLSLAEAAKRAGMSEQKFSDMMKQA
jgi:hypothetical protein